MKQPTRRQILSDILDCFQGMYQWVCSPEHYSKYAHKAEALIELLEVVDCGSVGGFDRNNQSVVCNNHCCPKNATGFRLFDRFLMVLNKYSTNLTSVCGHNVEFFFKFFKKLALEK
jgi:hypothetical protein